MNKKRYNKWSKWLINNGFKDLPSEFVFELNEGKIKFSNTCSFSEKFIKERYFMFFSDFEILEISEKIKKDFFSKRPSMYDAQSISKKSGISIKEAESIVNERKSKTSGSLENFIKRHGEKEGKKRFDKFCEKSSHTKDKYIKKYGEKEGLERWNSYRKTKGKSKENYLIEFGAEEGTKKWEEVQQKRKVGSSRAGIESKYGKSYYDELIKKRNFKVSLEGYLLKYGLEAGKQKWTELLSSRDNKSFESILKNNNNNYELAKEIYEVKNMKSSPIYSELKKLYGEELATKKYKEGPRRNFGVELPIHKSKPHLRAKKGCVSSESRLFFQKLEDSIGRKLKFGDKKEELKLFNEEFKEIYYYDCFDNVSNTIIEFNGVAFHPKEKQKDFVNVANNKSYEESIKKDKRKVDFAKSLGYNVHVVWSDEVKKKHDRIRKLNFLKKEMESK